MGCVKGIVFFFLRFFFEGISSVVWRFRFGVFRVVEGVVYVVLRVLGVACGVCVFGGRLGAIV